MAQGSESSAQGAQAQGGFYNQLQMALRDPETLKSVGDLLKQSANMQNAQQGLTPQAQALFAQLQQPQAPQNQSPYLGDHILQDPRVASMVLAQMGIPSNIGSPGMPYGVRLPSSTTTTSTTLPP